MKRKTFLSLSLIIVLISSLFGSAYANWNQYGVNSENSVGIRQFYDKESFVLDALNGGDIVNFKTIYSKANIVLSSPANAELVFDNDNSLPQAVREDIDYAALKLSNFHDAEVGYTFPQALKTVEIVDEKTHLLIISVRMYVSETSQLFYKLNTAELSVFSDIDLEVEQWHDYEFSVGSNGWQQGEDAVVDYFELKSNSTNGKVYIDKISYSYSVAEDKTLDELLTFDSQDSLSIVTGGYPGTVNVVTDGDSTALSAEITRSNPLRIDLGEIITVADVAEIRITYKIDTLSSGTYIRFWINGDTRTGDSDNRLKNISVTTSDFVTDIFLQTEIITALGESTAPLSDITFGVNDGPTYKTTMLIDSIEIVYKKSLEELLQFDSQDSLSIVTGGYPGTVNIVTEGDCTALSAEITRSNPLRIDLGEIITVADVAEIHITYKVDTLSSGTYIRFWINGDTRTGDSDNRLKNISATTSDFVTDIFLQTEIITALGESTAPLSDITFGVNDGPTYKTTMLIDSILIILK